MHGETGEQVENKIFFGIQICTYKQCTDKKRQELGDFWRVKRGLTRCAIWKIGTRNGGWDELSGFGAAGLRGFRPCKNRKVGASVRVRIEGEGGQARHRLMGRKAPGLENRETWGTQFFLDGRPGAPAGEADH